MRGRGEQEGEQRGRSRQEAGGAILEIKCHSPLNMAQIQRRYSEGMLQSVDTTGTGFGTFRNIERPKLHFVESYAPFLSF